MASVTVKNDRKTTNGRNAKSGRSVRRYRPDLESLESVCLLNGTLPAPDTLVETGVLDTLPAPDWSFDSDWNDAANAAVAIADHESVATIEAWDQVLADRAILPPDDLYQRSADAFGESLAQSGFGRISTYLGRTWRKAGIESPQDEDCTQSVYLVLLERWGRDRFEDVAAEVGRTGLNRLIDRNDLMGLDFLRALDQVKKQAQRQQRKAAASLSALADTPGRDWSDAPDLQALGRDLENTIAARLDPRETDLIRATIAGDSPADIAARWGVSPKTVSNLKSEIISKLRPILTGQPVFAAG